MKSFCMFLVLLFALTLAPFAELIDGSKTPDKVPDRVAFRLFLRGIASLAQSKDANTRLAVNGLLETYHFNNDDKVKLLEAALKLDEAEKKNEQDFVAANSAQAALEIRTRRRVFTADLLNSFRDNDRLRDALKEIKRAVKLDSSEVDD